MSVLVLFAIGADIPEEEDSSITINGQEFPYYSKEVTTSLSPVERWSAPYSVTVISPNASQNIGSNNAADLLEHQAGLTVAHYGGAGNLSNLSMRGSQTGAVLVLKDGVPINDIQSGGIDLNLVATGGLGQAELVQGPGASTVYGANAMGGVVNFVSAPLSKERIRVKGAGSYGTDNTTDVIADFSVPFTNKLALGVGAGIAHSDGFREHSKADSQEQSMTLEYGTLGNGFGSTLRYSRKAKTLEVAGPASYPVDENALQKDDIRLVGWNGVYQDESSYVTGTASYRNGSLKYTSSDYMTGDPVTDEHKTDEVFGRLLGQRKWGIFKGTIGSDYKTDTLDSTSVGKHDVANVAGMAQTDFDLSPVHLIAGARYDENDVWGGQLTPQASVIYRPQESLALRLTYAQGFRAPTFNELFWPDTGFGGGNPNLKPEHSQSVELGANYELPSFYAALSGFTSQTKDLINGWPPENIDKVDSFGGEFNARTVIIERLWLDGYTAYLSAKDVELDEQVDYKPAITAGAGIAWIAQYGIVGLRSRLGYDYVGSRFYHALDPATYESVRKEMDAYGLANAKVEVKAYGASVFLRCDNLADTVYQIRDDYPMPGRTFAVGVSMEY